MENYLPLGALVDSLTPWSALGKYWKWYWYQLVISIGLSHVGEGTLHPVLSSAPAAPLILIQVRSTCDQYILLVGTCTGDGTGRRTGTGMLQVQVLVLLEY